MPPLHSMRDARGSVAAAFLAGGLFAVPTTTEGFVRRPLPAIARNKGPRLRPGPLPVTPTSRGKPRTPPPTQKPPASHRRPWAEVKGHIAACESGGDSKAANRRSTASGLYQALDSTWHGFGGYRRARDAPLEVQDRHAAELYAARGLAPWAASSGCWRSRIGR